MPDNWDCHAYVIQRTFSARIPPNPTPRAIRDWFDSAAEAAVPVHDGTIGTARLAADAYARRAKADNTRRAYRAGVRAWCTWCASHELPCLPNAAADAGELPAKKLAATADILRQILAGMPDDLAGLRDRALLLVGFAGALRRAELAAIRIEHIEASERGLRLTLPRSKGDRTGSGVTVAIPYGATELCPVRALRRWQEAANITAGAVFRRIFVPPTRQKAGEGPAPPPWSAPGRSMPAPWRGSSRPALPRPVSTPTRLAATVSSAARSPPAWTAAFTRPGSSSSAGTRATRCSTNTSNSVIRSKGTRLTGCCSRCAH